ncbi:MAG: TetR/AcrR family transcriptional regulator [Syntrophobacteraceae bacterium]|jgi:AcrR family transcriptional regulator|nr:TetR/AcrR family transcriptional regulator [Syntrophobacteraceae bacterium]
MSTSKYATKIRRDQIARAALELIAARGMKGFSVAGLAHRIGFTPSAIYHHFKGKDEILDAVLDLLQDRLLGNVAKARADYRDSLAQLNALLSAHAQLVLGLSAMPRILFSEDVYGENSSRKARLNDIITGYLREVAGIVREGQIAGTLRTELDPDTISVMFLGLVQPTAILWHLSDGKFDAAGHVERAWPVFLEAIRLRAG